MDQARHHNQPRAPTLGELGSLSHMLLDCASTISSDDGSRGGDMNQEVGWNSGGRPLVLGPTIRPLANALWRRNRGLMCGCSSSSSSVVITTVAINRIQRGMRMYEVDLCRRGAVTTSSSSSASNETIEEVISTPLEEYVCGYRPLGLRDLLPPTTTTASSTNRNSQPPLLFHETDVIGHPTVVPDANTLLLAVAIRHECSHSSHSTRGMFRASLVREMIVRGVSASTDAATLTDDERVRAVFSRDLTPSLRRRAFRGHQGTTIAGVDLCQVGDGEVRCVVGSLGPHVTLQRVVIRGYDTSSGVVTNTATFRSTHLVSTLDDHTTTTASLHEGDAHLPLWNAEQVHRLGMKGIVELVTGVAVMDNKSNRQTRWKPIPTELRLWNCGVVLDGDQHGYMHPSLSNTMMGSRVASSHRTGGRNTPTMGSSDATYTTTSMSSFLHTTPARAGCRQRVYPCDWLPLPPVGVVLTTSLAYAILDPPPPLTQLGYSRSGGDRLLPSSLTIGGTQCSPRLLESLAISHHNYRLTSLTLDTIGMDVQLVHVCTYLRGELQHRSGLASDNTYQGLTTLRIRNMPHCFSTLMPSSSPSQLGELGGLIGALLPTSASFTLEIANGGLHDNHVRELFESILSAYRHDRDRWAHNTVNHNSRLSLYVPHNSLSSVRRCFMDPTAKFHEEMGPEGVECNTSTHRILSSLNLAGNVLTSTSSQDLIDLVACVMREAPSSSPLKHHRYLNVAIRTADEVDDRLVHDAIYNYMGSPSLNLNHSLTASLSPLSAFVSWMRLAKKEIRGGDDTSQGNALLWGHVLATDDISVFTLPFLERGSLASLHLAVGGSIGVGGEEGCGGATWKQLRQLLPTCGLITTYPWVVDAQSVKTVKRELRRVAMAVKSTALPPHEPTTDMGPMVEEGCLPPDSWEDACELDEAAGNGDQLLTTHTSALATTTAIIPSSCTSDEVVVNPIRSLASCPRYPTSLCLSGWDFSAALSVSQVLLPVLPGLVTLDLSRTSVGVVEQLAAAMVKCVTALDEVACEFDTLFKLTPPTNVNDENNHAKLPLRHLVLDSCGLCANESSATSLRLLLKSIGSSICPCLQSLSLKYNNSGDGIAEGVALQKGSKSCSNQSHNHPSTKKNPHSQKSSMSSQLSTLMTTTTHHERIMASLAHDDHNVPVTSKADLIAFLKADARTKRRAATDASDQTHSYVDPTPGGSSSSSTDGDMAATPFTKSLCSFLSRMVSPATFVRLDLSGCSQGIPNIRCVLHIQQSLEEGKVKLANTPSKVDCAGGEAVVGMLQPPIPPKATVHLRHIDPVWSNLLPHHPLFTLPPEDGGGSSVDGRRYVCSIF